MTRRQGGRFFLVAIFGMVAIGATSIALVQQAREHRGADADVVRAATEQLVLSHEISDLAVEILAGDAPPAGLSGLLSVWERTHLGLRGGDPGLGLPAPDSPELERLFTEIEPAFAAVRQAALRLAADPGDTAAADRLLEWSAEYRTGMEAVVTIVEGRAAQRAGRLARTETAAIGLTLLTAAAFVMASPMLTRRTGGESAVDRIRRTLASVDHLTGLPRRHAFRDRLVHALERIARQGGFGAVIHLDLDHFTLVNDAWDTATGDRVLQEVAHRLRDTVRASDAVARLEGDQFAVLLEGSQRAEDAGKVAEKILASLAQPIALDLGEVSISASAGIAIAPLDASDADRILDHALTACQAAKRLGRSTYHYFSPELKALAHGRIRIIEGVRRALETGTGLRLVYQPQIDLRTGRLAGVEALIRWDNPESGEVLPADFIPIAEESELILSIGRWVFDAACRQAALWHQSELGSVRVAVNVSARQFRHGDLIEIISTSLTRHSLPPRLLEIELTEGVLMDDTEHAREVLSALRNLGVTVAVDDFGTGYSSLSYLKAFPIDALKIDQSFIRELASTGDDAAIATAIIALSHSLGLQVIAEGVEDDEQLGALRTLGCDVAQGFLLARPMPGPDVDRYVRDQHGPAPTRRSAFRLT